MAGVDFRRGRHRLPKPIRALAFAAAALIIGGVAVSMGNAFAFNGFGQNSGSGQRGDNNAAGRQGVRVANVGPFRKDFVDIRSVQPNVRDLQGRSGSTGTFVSQCGRNEDGHHNSDNFIVTPGQRNGAHHTHDYVGNKSTNAFSTNRSLLQADTTCQTGDRSAYFWPVLRSRDGVERDQNAPGGGRDGNVGTILTASSVQLQFRGNAANKVSPMPRFLRVITGDAKAASSGDKSNARARWTCSGFEDRFTAKYPICPQGSQVKRVLDFPSCWDGRNLDSENHRTHMRFPNNNGQCPSGTRAVPQLRMVLTYDVPAGQTFALDTFPEEKHNPVTDHGDFANVMPNELMNFAVNCINSGQRCGG
ncbi:hypothetical protein GCM10012275_47990 [Longimycelium tulufanense]|uniref:DUF1996 domain-containing protein n=1 Tax=Longimycelium tulufanense TaxID=907463 RepID=A0A8J3FVV6_9PSEU|nr:DUF1996 domain-containing protein [Longimycelium tulufanense]GGM71867.1 hypothetical protein GCM10012275_47990 [Longimycelium tulufanense]